MTLHPLRRNRLLAGVLTAALAITGIAAGAGSAAADRTPPHKIDYVALGDDYAAGRGGGEHLDSCLHTAVAYPEVVDALAGVRLKADATCAGTTARDLVTEQIPWVKRKLQKAELVTITVGIEDLLTKRMQRACDVPAAETASVQDHGDRCAKLVKKAVERVKHWLFKALKRIDHLNPRVKVIVTGYPLFWYDPDEEYEHRVTAALKKLNSALRHTVLKARDHGVHVSWVKVWPLFLGHQVDTPFPMLHPDGPDRWYPNESGHGGYGHLVSEKVLRLFFPPPPED
jgi:lysophospholipase L1-like esterase